MRNLIKVVTVGNLCDCEIDVHFISQIVLNEPTLVGSVVSNRLGNFILGENLKAWQAIVIAEMDTVNQTTFLQGSFDQVVINPCLDGCKVHGVDNGLFSRLPVVDRYLP